MTRTLRVAGAQMGPVQMADSRDATLRRLIALLDRAADTGARLVVFPELALTTFFPRWLIHDERELLSYFERGMPNPGVRPLFERARERGVGFHLGYAELTPEGQRFNSAVTVGPDGRILAKYRKIHLPGTVEPRPNSPVQQLEKRYFTPGDGGFQVFEGFGGRLGMLICNDRRWPEAWRVLGLQQIELVLIGYNSAGHDPYGVVRQEPAARTLHSTLLAQANSYMNATWCCAVAKAGEEDGAPLIGGSCIVHPDGVVVAQATTLDDEVIVATVDLDEAKRRKKGMFDFAHRRPEMYGAITAPQAAP